MHILAWVPFARGASGQLPSVPMRLDNTESTDTFLVHLYIYIHMVQGYVFNLVFLCAYAQLYWYFQRNQCLSIIKTWCTQICTD
jgi:hypothetical protein